ncbi:hypothetical protein ACJX0J_031010, partial [Zea mays]
IGLFTLFNLCLLDMNYLLASIGLAHGKLSTYMDWKQHQKVAFYFCLLTTFSEEVFRRLNQIEKQKLKARDMFDMEPTALELDHPDLVANIDVNMFYIKIIEWVVNPMLVQKKNRQLMEDVHAQRIYFLYHASIKL